MWKKNKQQTLPWFKAIYLLFCYFIYLFKSDYLNLTLNDFMKLLYLVFEFKEFHMINP